MANAPGTLPMVAAFLGLFLGAAVVSLGLAEALAPGSWIASAVSLFALPVALAAGLQAWYGLALLGLLPRLLGWLRGGARRPVASGRDVAGGLAGAWVFLPLSSAAGAVAGVVVGLVSSAQPAWLIVLVYCLVGTVHGLIAWRLARRGVLLPPESL